MQNTVFPMITDLWVNLANMLASWLLSFYTPLGIKGIAYGTLIAQWTGLLLAFLLMRSRYRDLLQESDKVMSLLTAEDLADCFTLDYYFKNVDYIFGRVGI